MIWKRCARCCEGSSLLRALDQRNSACFWFESGTMTSLIDHLQHYPIKTALEYDGVEVGLDEFFVPCEYAPTPIFQVFIISIKVLAPNYEENLIIAS